MKAVFFDVGMTLIKNYFVEKNFLFEYICKNCLPEYDLSKFNLDSGARFSEVHFQNSCLKNEYKNSKTYWRDNYFYSLIASGVPYNLSGDMADKIKRSIANLAKRYSLTKNSEEVLKILKSNGLKLAVVSNWKHGLLKNILKKVNIYTYFDYIADSSIENVEKPNAEIFNIVLNKLNLKPNEVLHLGDTYYTDIIGAKNARITPILLDELNILKRIFNCNCINNIKEILDYI